MAGCSCAGSISRPRAHCLDVPVADVQIDVVSDVKEFYLDGLDGVDGVSWASHFFVGEGMSVIPGQYTVDSNYGPLPGTLQITGDTAIPLKVASAELRVRLAESGGVPVWLKPPALRIESIADPSGSSHPLALTGDGSFVAALPIGRYRLSAVFDGQRTVVVDPDLEVFEPREIEAEIEWVEIDFALALEGPSPIGASLGAVPEVGGDSWVLADAVGGSRFVLPRGRYQLSFGGARISDSLEFEHGDRLRVEVVVRELELPRLNIDGREATGREREALALRRRSDPTIPQLAGAPIDPTEDGYQLLTGTYDVFWNGGSDLPAQNQNAYIGCFNVRRAADP
jgi:hypothetical protein